MDKARCRVGQATVWDQVEEDDELVGEQVVLLLGREATRVTRDWLKCELIGERDVLLLSREISKGDEDSGQ